MKARLLRARDWITSWRLPVRIPVPNRDNLIAMGLTALALGLITGVVIGPGLGPAGSAIAGVVAPAATPMPEEPAVEAEVSDPGVELGTPAGSESLASSSTDDGSTSVASVDTPEVSTDYPDPEPSLKEPANEIESDPETPVKKEPETEVGTELKGTVVGVDPKGRRFSLADSSGNVLVLFAPEPPVTGDAVATHILPLANGTFAEAGERKITASRAKSKLRGTVSWIDPLTRIAVVSSRGSSLAVDLGAIPVDPAAPIETGSPVEGVVAITEPVEATETEPAKPGLVAEKMVAAGAPLDRIEMSGSLKATDETVRSLTITADSAGSVSAEIVVGVPKNFPFVSVTKGRVYDLTATRNSDGTLTLTGLSPGYSKKAANDAELAFGDHG